MDAGARGEVDGDVNFWKMNVLIFLVFEARSFKVPFGTLSGFELMYCPDLSGWLG